MQLGFVGLGKMGGNMVHRIHRDSDHQVVAFDLNDEHVREAEGTGAKGVASLDELVSQPRGTAAWCGSWSRPARRPSQTIDALADLLQRGRHDHRRRQHEVARRRRPRRRSRSQSFRPAP